MDDQEKNEQFLIQLNDVFYLDQLQVIKALGKCEIKLHPILACQEMGKQDHKLLLYTRAHIQGLQEHRMGFTLPPGQCNGIVKAALMQDWNNAGQERPSSQ